MSYFAGLQNRQGLGPRKWFNVAKIDDVKNVDLPVNERITISLDDEEKSNAARDDERRGDEHEEEEEEVVPIGRVCEEVDLACRSYDPLGVTGVPRIQKSALTVPVPFAFETASRNVGTLGNEEDEEDPLQMWQMKQKESSHVPKPVELKLTESQMPNLKTSLRGEMKAKTKLDVTLHEEVDHRPSKKEEKVSQNYADRKLTEPETPQLRTRTRIRSTHIPTDPTPLPPPPSSRKKSAESSKSRILTEPESPKLMTRLRAHNAPQNEAAEVEKPKSQKKEKDTGPRPLTEPKTPKLMTKTRVRATQPDEAEEESQRHDESSHKRKRRAMECPRIGEGVENEKEGGAKKKMRPSYTLTLTEPQPFALSTENRSSTRQQYDEALHHRTQRKEEEERRHREEKERAERREIRKLRSEMVHKACPITHYPLRTNHVTPQPSLTVPQSPNLHTKSRAHSSRTLMSSSLSTSIF